MSSYWLMKTEPDKFSFEDLIACPKKTDHWDGIRNYQARNLMRDQFKKGDLVFIYHSRIKKPAVVGVAQVVKEAYPDHTALDESGEYFDPKSLEAGASRWVMVDVKAKERFSEAVTLEKIRQLPALGKMALVQKGQRLSIQPVTAKEWQTIYKLGKALQV